MAENLIADIKAAEDKAAAGVREAKATAARRLNQARAEAESALKEARQSSARQFRERIAAAEQAAETKAKGIVSGREAAAKTFYEQNKKKVANAASWITEEVMVRYGRN
ncbi:MAG: hypothetical protein GX256_06290 [Fretibacterium sp.]|nr:hypothetical protein [Fretibacterium sp.]